MSPGQLLMMRRQGPGLQPGEGGRLAPAAPAGGAPGGDLGQMVGSVLAQLGTAQGDYVTKVVENMKRTAAVMIAKLNQSHPEVARHMTRAYTSLDAALSAAKKSNESSQQMSNAQPLARPPLGFSGAATETQAPNPNGIMSAA